jgi:hypothetical protein
MAKKRRPTVRQPFFARLSDERLLDVRLSELAGHIQVTALRAEIDQLYHELRSRGIAFRPHVWLSNEWFTPDYVPGIAIPFYLAHPRLRELERSQMLDVEGGTHDWCMRILRHEAGHAIDHAYLLHRRQRYRRLFGPYTQPYPDSYRPKPYTKSFVIHLDMWYAQAHPAEDFAETFAVWLNPGSAWRDAYAGWPALRKLEYVDALMQRIQRLAPTVRTRRHHHPLRELRITLREHYEQRRRYYVRDYPRFYDRDLRRLFSADRKFARRREAVGFMEEARAEVRAEISRWTGESQLTIDRALADMIERARQLGLRLMRPARQTRQDLLLMLAVQTMNYLNDGKHRVVL